MTQTAAQNRPLTDVTDAALLQAVRDGFAAAAGTRIAVAVSGGGDSLALLHLMQRVAPTAGWHLSAVTVDHALRTGSAGEAAGVARFCADLGLQHATLRWDHGAISGNLMDQARKARTRLISDWAVAAGVTHVALGHTADDVAETLLMGLARGSGLDGLAGLRRQWRHAGLTWMRPLLTCGRGDLRAYLHRNRIAWVDDPTNDDDRFTRSKARKALAVLAPLGITVAQLATTANHLAMAQDALHDTLRRFAVAHVHEAAGGLQIAGAALDALSPDLQRRLYLACITAIAGPDYPPRMRNQANLLAILQQRRDATLAGLRFRWRDDMLHICREAKAVAALRCASTGLWDGRWRLSGPHDPAFQIGALGADGLRQIKDWRASGHSREYLIASPAVWSQDTLISAPITGFFNGWQARIVTPFDQIIVSH